MFTSKRKIVVLIAGIIMAALLAFPLAQNAYAVETDTDGVIEAGEVINDDVYLAGDRVLVNGVVNGDLFASGSVVVVNGEVNGSVFIAAQSLEVNGKVSGSVYGASYSIVVGNEAEIGRNFYYAGFSFESKPNSFIKKDLMVAGYQAVIAGNVERDVNAAVGGLELSGKVGRNVSAAVGDPEAGTPATTPFFAPPGAPPMMASGLRVTKDAVIGGSLTYSSQKEQKAAILAEPKEGVVFKKIEQETKQSQPYRETPAYQVGKYILARLQELVTLFVLGAVALWLIPQYLGSWSERVRKEPLASGLNGLLSVIVGYAGAGLVFLVLLAVVIFLSVLTLGGLSRSAFGIGFSAWGLALAVFTLLVSYGSKLVVAFLAGEMLFNRFAPQYIEKKYWVMFTGVLVYIIVRSIPILGWIVGLLVTLVGVGAMYLTFRDKNKERAQLAVSE